jgi:hypothetical protein
MQIFWILFVHFYKNKTGIRLNMWSHQCIQREKFMDPHFWNLLHGSIWRICLWMGTTCYIIFRYYMCKEIWGFHTSESSGMWNHIVQYIDINILEECNPFKLQQNGRMMHHKPRTHLPDFNARAQKIMFPLPLFLCGKYKPRWQPLQMLFDVVFHANLKTAHVSFLSDSSQFIIYNHTTTWSCVIFENKRRAIN